MPLPLDIVPILRAVTLAIESQDVEKLLLLAGIFESLLESVRKPLARTLCGSVTEPIERGRLLSVKEAAAQTGLPASYFYRHATRLSSARRPSPGRLMFLESALIAELSKGRLP